MKKYSLAVAAFTAAALFTGSVTLAQDAKEKKEKDEKDKLGQYDEIIIRKKSDKDDKVTIEIKNGEVFVNGKPLDDYDNDNLSIRKNKTLHFGVASPFRGGSGQMNYSEERAFLGVTTEDAPGGARITAITKNSAAEKYGLKRGDIITKIDKEKISEQEDVSKVIRSHKPDDKVDITIQRDGKEQTISATLGKTKSSYSINGTGQFYTPELDIEPFRNFNFDLRDNGLTYNYFGKGRLGIKAQDTEDGKGVKVLNVTGDSPAAKAGIKENDIITEFNGKTVNGADELAKVAMEAREKPSVNVKLLRDGKSQTVEIKTPKKLKTANL